MHLDLQIICDGWKETSHFRKLVKATQQSICHAISDPAHTSISFSGGKDSLVLLHLITSIYPTINVWHWDYGIFMPREFENAIMANLKQLAPAVNLIYDKRYSKNPHSASGYQGFYGAINKYTTKKQISLTIIGLRKEESCARKSRLTRGKFEKYSKNNTLFFPLADWTWRDIWSYLYIHQISYPEIYDLYGPLLGWEKVRFVTFFDPEFEFLGGPNLDKFFLYEMRNQYV